MHKGQEHFKYVLKTFKVAELDKLLTEKKKPTTGQKADKAMAVAWIYTRQEIEQWKEMEKERDVEMKAKAHKEKQDRDEQLAFDQKRRDEELAKQEKEEKALVSKIVREMEQEKVRMAAKISKIGRVQL